MSSKQTDIICFSMNNWEKRWARKQHFMRELAQKPEISGVFYLEPPVGLHDLILGFLHGKKDPEWKARWKRALLVRADVYGENLRILTPLFVLPFMRIEAVNKINRWLSLFFMRLMGRLPPAKGAILWLYHPYDHYLAQWFKDAEVTVFDWAEKWTDWFVELKGRAKKSLADREIKILEEVDIVFSVSKSMEREAALLNRNSYFLPSGTVTELFEPGNNGGLQEIMKHVKKPCLGYIGTINERFDVETVYYLAKAFPEASIVLVGNIHEGRVDLSSLKGLTNIHFQKGVDFWELASYTNGFDVCILPYVAGNTQVEPTKIYDYLATGKPVISSIFQEALKFEGLIELVGSKEEFFIAVKRVLKDNSPKQKERRLKASREASWKARADEIMRKLRQVLLEKEKRNSLKKLLVIPHFAAENSIRVREMELAKALSAYYNVTYLTWFTAPQTSIVKRLLVLIMDIFRRPRSYHKGFLTVVQTPIFRRPLKWASRLNGKRLKRFIRKEKIDYLLNASVHAFPAPGEKTVPDLKYIYDLVDLPYSKGKDSFEVFKQKFVSAEIKKASLIVTVSESLSLWLKENHRLDSFVLPNGVDLENINNVLSSDVIALKERLGISGKFVYSLIGNFGGWVNVKVVLESFISLKKEMPDAVLLIVGPGAGLTELKKTYSNADVIFTGPVKSFEINKYFLASDVGLLASEVNEFQNKAFHIKIIEYTAAKKIIISTPMQEVLRSALPNVIFSDLTSENFMQKMKEARELKWNDGWNSIVLKYDWKDIARVLAEKMEKL